MKHPLAAPPSRPRPRANEPLPPRANNPPSNHESGSFPRASARPAGPPRPRPRPRPSPIGIYPGPFGFVLSVPVAGAEHLVPVAVEDAAALAPIARALAVVRRSGGFQLTRGARRTAEVLLTFESVPDAARAERRLLVLARDLLELGARTLPERRQVRPSLELRKSGATLALGLYGAGPDARDAAALSRVAEAMLPALTRLVEAGARVTLQESVRRRVQATCRVALAEVVAHASSPGSQERGHERGAIERALGWLAAARRSPVLAAAQNDVVLTPVAGVARALGYNAQRPLADAQAYAARFGATRPLARLELDGAWLTGCLLLPCGGGRRARRRDAASELAQRLLLGHSVEDIAALSACIGLAAHLGVLRAAVSLSRSGSMPSPAAAAPLPAARANCNGATLAPPADAPDERLRPSASQEETRVAPAPPGSVLDGRRRATRRTSRPETREGDETRVMRPAQQRPAARELRRALAATRPAPWTRRPSAVRRTARREEQL